MQGSCIIAPPPQRIAKRRSAPLQLRKHTVPSPWTVSSQPPKERHRQDFNYHRAKTIYTNAKNHTLPNLHRRTTPPTLNHRVAYPLRRVHPRHTQLTTNASNATNTKPAAPQTQETQKTHNTRNPKPRTIFKNPQILKRENTLRHPHTC